MIIFKKKVLFFLMFISINLVGISLFRIDWTILETGSWIDIFNETNGLLANSILSILFMLLYVKKIKEDKKK